MVQILTLLFSLLFCLLFCFATLFLLEHNCFTTLCWFLLHNEVNQLYTYIPHYPPPHPTPGPPSHPLPHPTPLVINRTIITGPCTLQQLPSSYFTYGDMKRTKKKTELPYNVITELLFTPICYSNSAGYLEMNSVSILGFPFSPNQ